MTAAILLAISLSMVAGCKQTAKDLWKDTRKYYREYLNTPATLDFEPADAEPVEERLATVYTPVGLALEAFRRDLDNKDIMPEDEWIEGMLSKHSWLSGITVVSPEGVIYKQRPEAGGLKALDFTPLFSEEEQFGYRELRAYSENNPLGPEIYVGKPFFVDNDMKGLIVAHFDPRALLSVCPDPARLVIISPTMTLWAGHYIMDTTPLDKVDWKTTLQKETSATFGNDLGEFLWVSKFIGNMPLVFATTSSEFPIDESQMDALMVPEPMMDVPTVEASPAQEEVAAAPMTDVTEAPLAAAVLPPDMKQPALNDTPEPAKPTSDYVWSVQIGAFHNPEYAQDRIELLQSFGYSPCLMDLYDKHGQLWHVVQIFDSPDKVAAFKEVRTFIKKGTGLDYNVEILDAGVVSRRKKCF